MNTEDTNGSKPASTSPLEKTFKRTKPNCGRCRNHNLNVPLQGHKRYCAYQKCPCEKCKLTLERQNIMARQTAQKRAIQQDEKKVMLPGEVQPTPLNVPDTSGSLGKKQKNDDFRILLECTLTMMHQFCVNWWPLLSVVGRDLAILFEYVRDSNTPINLTDAKFHMSRVLSGMQIIMLQHGACCYFPPSGGVGAPTYERQVHPIGIGTPQKPFQLYPIVPLDPLTVISTPPRPDNLSESSTEPTYHW